MNSLIKKVEDLLPFLEKQGPVYLFAFAERADLDRWDVVLSAEWSDHEIAMAVFKVSRELHLRLEPQEMTMLGSIAVVPSTDPNFQRMLSSTVDLSTNKTEVVQGSFLGSDIKKAFVFKVRRPPAEAARVDSGLGILTAPFS